MHRGQDRELQLLRLDRWGETLHESEVLDRLRRVFNHYGGGLADSKWSALVSLAVSARAEEDALEDALVFLCRYGRFDVAWVEEQDVDRVMRLLEKVGAWIARENGKREEQPATVDTAGDFG